MIDLLKLSIYTILCYADLYHPSLNILNKLFLKHIHLQKDHLKTLYAVVNVTPVYLYSTYKENVRRLYWYWNTIVKFKIVNYSDRRPFVFFFLVFVVPIDQRECKQRSVIMFSLTKENLTFLYNTIKFISAKFISFSQGQNYDRRLLSDYVYRSNTHQKYI